MTSEDEQQQGAPEHPNPSRFWGQLLRVMHVGLFLVLAVLAIAAWAWLVQGREEAASLLEACVWAGVVLILVYGARDAVEALVERYRPPGQ